MLTAGDAYGRVDGIPPVRGGLSETVGAAVALVMIFMSGPRFRCVLLDPAFVAYPTRAVALLKESGVEGNMAVYFDWGEFAIWHLGPGVKVSMDGRRETVYAAATYNLSVSFQTGTDDWDALLKTTPTDMVLVPRRSPTSNLLSRADGWHQLYADSLCRLFVRADLPLRGRLEGTAVPNVPEDGRGLCFPAASPTQAAGGG